VRHRAGLGKAVALADARSRGVLELLEPLHRHGGRAGHAIANGGEVVGADIFLLQKRDVYRGSARKHGGPFLVDGLEHIRRHIAWKGNLRGAKRRAQVQAHGKAIDVEVGQHAQEQLAVFAHAGQHGRALQGVGAQAGVGYHAALGQARGAAGILQKRQVLLCNQPLGRVGGKPAQKRTPGVHSCAVVGHLAGLSIAPGAQLVKHAQGKAQCVGYGGDEVLFDAQLRTQRLNLVPQKIQCDEEARAGIGELVDDFRFHIQRVGEHHGAACAQHAPVGDDGLRGVGQHDGHAFAALEPVLAQVGGHQAGVFAQLGVGDAGVLEHDGRPVRPALGGLVQKLKNRAHGKVRGIWNILVVMLQPGAVNLGHWKTSWNVLLPKSAGEL